ncbi:hypothetical protein A3724_05905 [Alcanivorax sp. HI0033]|jgi:hypothetical protein|uniref:putative pilus system protein FilA n=1 Tax=unclassified Alcanivorax TaxID=2638842 RepID=UPI0007B873BB|nr:MULTISPECIES: DUF6160 family protein [unclassified Alcanivorax]KZX73778.1 hypothetical protein A3717_03520 [Alcanivorax sp. HI0013]KZX81598.1 hypothetical protein A3716_00700 [Alcanivorax sp. HI0011]KZY16134.1 hypothetical protein A3725_00660 [Alcanivorax sp. HI0035]KZX63750.1 hypothetical protein A3713_05285 [Alcanivorax sp. HI0003]KZX70986.1 hypothetical protein A3714_00775 [Alcanivorax sp. HI0007]
MKFKKLALAAAVAALPATGFSMEAMEDSALSGVTGQDGISIGLNTELSAELRIHDADGFADPAGNTSNDRLDSAALIFQDFAITAIGGGAAQIDLEIDAGTNAGNDPTLNINVDLANGIDVNMGDLDVADSGRTTASTISAGWTVGTSVGTNRVDSVISLGSLTLGAGTSLNIQLGNEAQGDMIAIDTTISNGISISGFAINDADSGGGITQDVSIVDNGGTDLTVSTGINVDTDSLNIGLSGIGNAGGMDVRLANLNIGNGAGGNVGDIELVGLQLSGSLEISGH